MRTFLKMLVTTPLLLAALSACAGGSDRYPSLALRPFETVAGIATPPAEPPAPIRPVASAERLSALRDQADSAHAAFARQHPEATRLAEAAAGQSPESNARAAALVAMADLSSSRGAVAGVLADLDLLAAEAATTFAPDAEIRAAQMAVAALIEAEDAAMAQLWKVIGA